MSLRELKFLGSVACAVFASSTLANDYAVLFELASPNAEEQGLYGASVSYAGDVNGDGYSDIIVGARHESPGGAPTWSGMAYVFSGHDGSLLRALSSPEPQTSGRFGASVAGVGDVNDDGFDDVAVGAWGESFICSSTGICYVFSGQTGTVLNHLYLPFTELYDEAFLGSSLACAGDVNGDGVNDIVAGAPGAVGICGASFVYDGSTGLIIHEIWSTGWEFGCSVAGAGDVNCDGYADVVIGDDVGAGSAYIHDGLTGAQLFHLQAPLPQGGSNFGYAVAGVGDLDGDHHDDVIVGAYDEDLGTGELSAGSVYAFSGNTGTCLKRYLSPNAQDGGWFGYSLAPIGDRNLDGVPDFLVGASEEQTDASPVSAGRTYLICGASGTALATFLSPNEETNGFFGESVAGMGDLDGDGYPEIIASALGEDPGIAPINCGMSYVYSIPRLDLTASLSEGSIILKWHAYEGAHQFWIYGAADYPHFEPGMAPDFEYRIDCLPGASTTWESSNGVGAPENNMTYLIVAVDQNLSEVLRSSRAGEFDFQVEY